ncbi:MAG: hypothetical protein IT337_16885, partial [Thermomicrobiales bacterium]|nr:hypothetical protein [Thermomicrobiales bacterium]
MSDTIGASDYLAAVAGNAHWPKAKQTLATWLAFAGLGEWVTEFRFHPTRKWRFDWALMSPALKIAVEYDGITGATAFNRKGTEGNASHASVGNIMRDAEKINEAQLLGWLVIRVNAKTIKSGQAFAWIETAVR